MFGEINLLNIVASILILIAVILSALTILALVGWWRGVDNVLFPGLGLIGAMPAIIVLLLILNIAFVVAAAVVKPKKESLSESKTKQDFNYPNDIFSGCGNGTLTLLLVKDPNNYNENTDRRLKVCINKEDLAAIQDAAVSGRIDYRNLQSNEENQKAGEHNLKFFQKFASLYPMLGKIDDMYQDYVFAPEEIRNLREECLKLQAAKPNAAADLALRKFIYACDEALKDNFYLEFSSD